MTIFEIIDERNRQLSQTRSCLGDIAKYLSNDHLTRRERAVAKQIEKNLKIGEKNLLNIGFCLPNVFSGDLLSLKTYYEYFDSLFFTEKNINAAVKARTKGHFCLDNLMDEKLSEDVSYEDWIEMSPQEQTEKETAIFMEAVSNRSKNTEFVNHFAGLLEKSNIVLEIEKNSFTQLRTELSLGGK